MCIKDDIIDKHNNAYQRTIKVKPINFVVERKSKLLKENSIIDRS